MRVLVTGGAGYIGSHTARWLVRHGHEIYVYDNLSEGHAAAAPEGRLIRAELADRTTLLETLRRLKIDAVMHFAASCYVGESVQDPTKYYSNNFVNALGLLDAMRQAGVSRIVFSSTCATYGIPLKVPITE